MPDALLASGSAFDRNRAKLGAWLREQGVKPRPLSEAELVVYGAHRGFRAGWAVDAELHGQVYRLEVLVDAQFPYSAIRIALRSHDVYLQWPHVESAGVLCLPNLPPPSINVADAAQASLFYAGELIAQCQEPAYVQDELQREFLSYWDHSVSSGEKRVRSLLDLANRNARVISVWFGKSFVLVGENDEILRRWLESQGAEKQLHFARGVFGYLGQPPLPPFPASPTQLIALLAQHAPDACRLLESAPLQGDMIVVLVAHAPSGDGLIAARITEPSTKGFRDREARRPDHKMTLWRLRSHLHRLQVDRFDAAWIHGRGKNQHIQTLQQAKVLVIGCGSLGSQVAVRLAQAGVGTLDVVDPDSLSAANVGRHALGVRSMTRGNAKATALAREILQRFPHLTAVTGHDVSWQALYTRQPQLFEQSDLIVACLGEWASDGQLAEWQRRSGVNRAIVYGWLEEMGSAAHAVALAGKGPSLTCLLTADGAMRTPETHWPTEGQMRSEPACGTLYQPYGPVDVAYAELLVTQLCLDVLTGAALPPTHRVWATATTKLVAAGGQWSEDHRAVRPLGLEGAFEYERPLSHCEVCDACQAAP